MFCVPHSGLRVRITAKGHLQQERIAAHDSSMDVRLAATGLVRGRTTDAAGQPIAGAIVRTLSAETPRTGQTATEQARDTGGGERFQQRSRP